MTISLDKSEQIFLVNGFKKGQDFGMNQNPHH